MEATVARWGNSLALRIPRHLANEAGLAEHTHVLISFEEGALVIRPKKASMIDDLLARVTDDNLHAEVSTGRRKGREAW
jgi:antitoxin MazE